MRFAADILEHCPRAGDRGAADVRRVRYGRRADPTHCRHGTKAPPSRRSSSSCRTTTDAGQPELRPAAERIATFDQDGTLWVEHPIYSQVMYCLDRVPALAKAKPELAKVEPFKTVLSGNREAIAKLPEAELSKIVAATLTGMSVDEFQAEVTKWIAEARDPRWKRPYTELTYLPMQEVL